MHPTGTLSAMNIRPFLGDDFLLDNDFAAELYHDCAARQPIIDYHCHLSPEDIASNRQFRSITEVWLKGDHYKWRALRTQGIPERFITGDASDWEKFEHWAATVPKTVRNPLFHWTHLELQRYFGIHDILNPASARVIFEETNAALRTPSLSTQGILQKMNVEVVCTTDDPTDDLAAHRQYSQVSNATKLLPTFRPDKAILIEKVGFSEYISRLGLAAGVDIRSFSDLLDALGRRMDYFASLGCRLSDHGLERLYAVDFTDSEADLVLKKVLNHQVITPAEAELYQSAVLFHLGVGYAQRGWTQQFHLGALRNNNSRFMAQLGSDTGFDSIGDFDQALSLARFLDRQDREDHLAQTILYNLNPRDNEVFATMIGNFNASSRNAVPGKIQWGSAWWFLDQKDGMEKQINTLSNFGLLSRFIGMLTDSRSFLSFPRHEYFRRILCNLIGRDVQNGELPADMDLLGGIVEDICYRNAKTYFQL
jgi:glucuronate isomerase